MQSAKDSFYVALRDRLAALNPERTVTLGATTRPAIVVVENELAAAAAPQSHVFYLAWGEARPVAGTSGARSPIFQMECAISYRTSGTGENAGVDRGRCGAELQVELAQILSPRCAAKLDHAQSPPADLGSVVLWTEPHYDRLDAPPGELRGRAIVTVFFWPEVELP